MQQPRLTTVMGVVRALAATLPAHEVVDVLVVEFGWDASFQALALSKGPDAERLFGLMWEQLLAADLRQDVNWPGGD